MAEFEGNLGSFGNKLERITVSERLDQACLEPLPVFSLLGLSSKLRVEQSCIFPECLSPGLALEYYPLVCLKISVFTVIHWSYPMESFLYSPGMYPHFCHPIQNSSHEEVKEHKSTTMES